MACEFNITKISKYVDGELARIEAAELEKHFASCEGCRAELDELKKNEMLIGAALKNHPFNAELAERVKRSLPARKPAMSRTVRYGAVALAACVLIAVAVIIFSNSNSPSGKTEVAVKSYSNDSASRRTIEFDGIAAITLNTGAKIKVSRETSRVNVALEKGQIFVAGAEGRTAELIIETPEARMRPVGTKFDVDRSERAGVFVTTLSVLEGRVELSTEKFMEVVPAHGQMSVANGYAPKPGAVGAAEKAAEWLRRPLTAAIPAPGTLPANPSGVGPIPPSDGGISTPDNSIGEPDLPAHPKEKGK
jgi:ferric-dicitrate binding protein FerR (iron transport regulator)